MENNKKEQAQERQHRATSKDVNQAYDVLAIVHV